MSRTNKARLGCESLEVRECPATLVSDDCLGGAPRPPAPPDPGDSPVAVITLDMLYRSSTLHSWPTRGPGFVG